MTNVVDFAARKALKAQEVQAEPLLGLSADEPAEAGQEAVKAQATVLGRGVPVPKPSVGDMSKEALLDILNFQFPTTIVVDERDRDFISDPAQHERARIFFRLFGFNMDELGTAEQMYVLWQKLSDFYVYFVQMNLADSKQFNMITCGESLMWHQYIEAVCAQDSERAARLSSVVHSRAT